MEFNPIKSVDGKACRCPSSYQWKLADVSASDAGRTEDTVMHKNRIRSAVRLCRLQISSRKIRSCIS